VGGYILLQWLVITVMTEVMPDLGMDIVVSPQTLITASVLGVLAVAIAPLLSYRKLRRMDLPSTLRVME
jgi:putative ABC transport system permease protein